MINHKGIPESIQEEYPLSCGFCCPAIHSRQACAMLDKIASLKKGRRRLCLYHLLCLDDSVDKD